MIEDGLSVVGRRWKGKVFEAIKLLTQGSESVGKLGKLLDIIFQPGFNNIELGNEVDGRGAKGGRVEGGFFQTNWATTWSAT